MKNKKMSRCFAALLALLTVASASGCAISAALEEDGGFKFNSTQVSSEVSSDVVLHDMPDAPSIFGGIAAPSIFSDYTEKPYGIVEGDIYVSVNGSDETGDGSKEKPYASLEKARDVIRGMKAEGKLPAGGLTVSIMAGEYRITEGFTLSEEDSGTEECPITYAAYGDGEVIFKGSMGLNASDFTAVGDDIKAILPDESKDKVLMVDLKKYGITKDQLTLHVVGDFQDQASRFGYASGPYNVELYIDRAGHDLARWPNEGDWLITKSIISEGATGESGAIFELTSVDMDRVKTWTSYDNVWVWGMLYTDFNDSVTPVSFDVDGRTMTCLAAEGGFVSNQGNPFFFFNVLDELDIPGEWYIDRENCIMYVYPRVDLADAEIELVVDFKDTMFSADNCNYITIKGLNFLGGHHHGIVFDNSDDCRLDSCKVYGVSQNGICLYGYRNVMYNCEAHYVGYSGLEISGGVKATLTFGNSLMENCYTTYWGLNNRTYTNGIGAGSYGNTVRHCEAAYSPACALGGVYGFVTVEYCIFHDCATFSNDTAMYNGSSLTVFNEAIRYNIFYNIGGNKYMGSNGLFWDDGMCGQTAYGNLFVNLTGQGISLGGGYANNLIGNIFINTMKEAVWYDQRMWEGFQSGNEFYTAWILEAFLTTPLHTQPWLEHAPYLSQVISDVNDDTVAAHFYANPAFSNFTNNLFFNKSSSIGNVHPQVGIYSAVRDNYLANFDWLDEVFVDPDNGDYRVKEDAPVWDTAPNFENIPYHLIGRY